MVGIKRSPLENVIRRVYFYMQNINAHGFSDNFLRETVEVWQPLSAEPLTMADAREIAESMTGFFAALARCAKEAEIRRNRPVPVGNQDDH